MLGTTEGPGFGGVSTANEELDAFDTRFKRSAKFSRGAGDDESFRIGDLRRPAWGAAVITSRLAECLGACGAGE